MTILAEFVPIWAFNSCIPGEPSDRVTVIMSGTIKNSWRTRMERPAVARTEDRGLVWGLLVLTIALRLLYLVYYRVNSDEPQHLHVVWAWAQGQIPYRDFFDNHTPLFHILCIPLLRLVGERADAVIWMRLLMFPLYLLTLVFTYRIARSVGSRRMALWATVFAALFTPLFLTTLEFRTDDLWAVLWTAVIAVLVSRPPNAVRLFIVGLLLGAAISVSMKTILLLMVLGLTTASGLLFMRWENRLPSIGVLAGWGAAVLSGFLVIPGVLLMFFASRHALPQLFYCVVGHNVVEGVKRDSWQAPVFLLMVGIWIGAMRRIWLRRTSDAPIEPRIVVSCANWLFLAILLGFWPSITSQDLPPWAPFFAIQAAGWIFFVPEHARTPWMGIADRMRISRCRSEIISDLRVHRPRLICLSCIVALMAGIAFCQLPWSNRARTHVDMMNDVLRLTGPNDWVADNKGETVFRKRSTYYILEKMTKKRFAKGLLKDDISDRIVSTRTCVAIPSTSFPDRARAFLEANFVAVGPLSVAGQVLWRIPDKSLEPFRFEVAIPARYAVVAEMGPLQGALDGTPFTGSRFLEAGIHTFRPEHPADKAVLVWAEAVDRGYTPFPLGKSLSHD